MKTSESTVKITEALALAHAKISTVPMTGMNPHFKSKFAKLSDIYSATNIPLSENGLAIVQGAEYQDNRVHIVTRLLHKSGEWIESELSLKPAQDSPQGLGSTISYGRRYAVSAILNLAAEEEDDGEAGEGRDKPRVELYTGTDAQKRALKSIMDDLKIEDEEEMKRIADAMKNKPMNMIRQLIQKGPH